MTFRPLTFDQASSVDEGDLVNVQIEKQTYHPSIGAMTPGDVVRVPSQYARQWAYYGIAFPTDRDISVPKINKGVTMLGVNPASLSAITAREEVRAEHDRDAARNGAYNRLRTMPRPDTGRIPAFDQPSVRTDREEALERRLTEMEGRLKDAGVNLAIAAPDRAGRSAIAEPAPTAPPAPPAFDETRVFLPRSARAAAPAAESELEPLGLTAPQRDALEDAGYTTAADVAGASDDDLLAVDGIGEATVRKIREAQRA